jgi:hypothetical protein
VKILETRTRQDGIVRRRYRVSAHRSVTTYEIPEAVMRSFSAKQLQAAIDAYNRAEEKRKRTDLIKDRLAEGWKPAAIAHDVGVSEAWVRMVRAQMTR